MVIWKSKKLEEYTTAIKGLTGLIFMILGFAVLNYGTKLETAVSNSINSKSRVSKELNGMDFRILTITIILSLVFLCRALIDLMYAWNLINNHFDSQILMISLMLLTELVPSLYITYYIRKKKPNVDESKNKIVSPEKKAKRQVQMTGTKSPSRMKEKLLNFEQVCYYSDQ